MAGIKALIGLAFGGSVGLMFLLLACALPQYDNWWPCFVLAFYVLAPIPPILSRRLHDDSGTSSSVQEVLYFITVGIVLSAFALPVVMMRAPRDVGTIKGGSCALVMLSNAVIFSTTYGFFRAFDSDEGFEYSNW